jgi:hypothetical protein
MHTLRNIVVSATLLLMLAAYSQPSIAQVSLAIGNLGSTSFEDGVVGPGGVFEQYVGYYSAGQFRDADGNKVAGTNALATTVPVEHFVWEFSKHRILGANYAVETLIPFIDVGLNAPLAGNNRVRGLGDIVVSPLMLDWGPRKIAGRMYFSHATFDIDLPTGKYSDKRLLNPGSNAVGLNPWYSFTFYPVKNSTKWEVSSRLHYLWNSTNNSPFVGYGFKSIQAGQAFNVNYDGSYQVRKGFRLGFNGYALQQLTDHKINGANLPNSRERVFGSGPGAEFGGQGLWFYANLYFESGAENYSQGTRVMLRMTKTFGGPPHEQAPPPPPPYPSM